MTARLPAIVETVVRYECPKCGNNCQCGVPYVPKTMRAAEAIKANPEKSDRAIAKEIGASPTIVGKAREELSTAGQLEDKPRIGLDGKERKKPIHWSKRVHPSVVYPAAAHGVTARTFIEAREQDDPLVVPNPDHVDEILASSWFASKIKPIIEGKAANDPEKSADALRRFRNACALLLPQMTDQDLAEAQNVFNVVQDLRWEVEQETQDAKDSVAKAKRIKWEDKHPEEAKAKARERAQAEAMQDEMDSAKEDNRGSGEAWSDIKDEWISDWIDNNWDDEREAEFEAEFQEQWNGDRAGRVAA
jgi:hypothetical protein